MRWVLLCLAMLTLAGPVRGQDIKQDDYKKLYNDTLTQLKAAQDRKAELAAHVADLEKQLQVQTALLNDLKRQAAAFMDKTYFLRSHYAAWTQFITGNASVKAQWDIFLESFAPMSAPPAEVFMDPDWPLSVKE